MPHLYVDLLKNALGANRAQHLDSEDELNALRLASLKMEEIQKHQIEWLRKLRKPLKKKNQIHHERKEH